LSDGDLVVCAGPLHRPEALGEQRVSLVGRGVLDGNGQGAVAADQDNEALAARDAGVLAPRP
jgi:hypothetical protein